MPRNTRVSYHDIKHEVTARIQNRIWPQGSLLPTEAELSAEFGCARATVHRALRELAEQGLVQRKRKSGTRVAIMPAERARLDIPLIRSTIEDMNAAYRYALVRTNAVRAPAWLSAQIGLAPDAQVLHLLSMHYADNLPFQFEERWINVATVPSVLDVDFAEVSPNEWLLSEVPFTNAEIAFCAVAASSRMAKFLAAPEGAPLFRQERTTWLQGAPVTFVRMTFRPGFRMSTTY